MRLLIYIITQLKSYQQQQQYHLLFLKLITPRLLVSSHKIIFRLPQNHIYISNFWIFNKPQNSIQQVKVINQKNTHFILISPTIILYNLPLFPYYFQLILLPYQQNTFLLYLNMRKNFRIQASNISQHLLHPHHKTLLLSNPYFLQLTSAFAPEELESLLAHVKVEFFSTKKHITINREKLYFTFQPSAVLTSKNGLDTQGPGSNAITDFENKYQEISCDQQKYFKKRVQVLYYRYQILKEVQGISLYGLATFFNKNIQKPLDIILAKSDGIIASLQRSKISGSIYSKMQLKYLNRIDFLKSFPILKYLPEYYFHLYLPSFIWKKHSSSLTMEIPKQQSVHFLREGEMTFSKTVQGEEVKLYKITGQQMFIVIEDVDQIKIESESVNYYSISKTHLDALISYSHEDQQVYQQFFQNMKMYNKKIMERACQFHKTSYLNGSMTIDTKESSSSTISPLIQRSFWHQNIFTKQFNKHIAITDQKKSRILKKLLLKSNADSCLYEYKPVIKTVPDMSQIKLKARMLKQNKYQKLKLLKRQSSLVSTYKQLVRAGLQKQLSHEQMQTPGIRTLRNNVNKSLPEINRYSDIVVKPSVFDLLDKYNSRGK